MDNFEINEKDIFFVVCAPPFNRNSGGIYALHSLAEDLDRIGCNTGILTTETRPGSKVKLIDLDFYNKIAQSGMMVVAIYPEIILNNTLKADYAVWWLLNFPGFINKSWDGDLSWADRLVGFTEEINSHTKIDSILTYPLYDPDFFRVNEDIEKDRIIYYANRILSVDRFLAPGISNCNLLTPAANLNYKELRDLFWRSKVFITSEWTGTAIIAQLCGVPVIFIESPILKPTLHKGRHFDFGSAWGLSDENIALAKGTLPKVREIHYSRKLLWKKSLQEEVLHWITALKNK